jgi:oxalate---CoA ligase
MTDITTVADLLRRGDAKAEAIGAPGRRPMTRGELIALADQVGGALRASGVGTEDAVAIVMPNGPENAAAFVAVACWATAAPLNPGYRGDEFDFYLNDLNAKALIIQAAPDAPARAVAAKRGITLIEMTPDEGGPAGAFTLSVPFSNAGSAHPAPEHVALVLHTSGTTSRPKIVPLRHSNLAASAKHIAATLALTPSDRSLVIMPLFHIHGLIGALSSSLYAGASVFCPPGGFNALKFFGWLEEAKPTWYSAVPTMHQTIVSRAERNAEILARTKLRFIRSSSSSLPPQVMKELEATFHCPVIESYGMTEATHQMTSNPLPPLARKPGTVGIAAGPDVAIMDNDGNILPKGATGEIVIRGPNVTAGYANNPKANAEAFTKGWFRTGDQGVMDPEGYVSITGRLKEIINRGGEKIAPREVDEVLMDHPAVAQVVTFGMPHAKLGEEVAAVVVLKEGQSATEPELRDFVGGRLADFKLGLG